jgi:hypothetical protein
MNIFNIKNTFKKVLERKWKYIYIAIDLHETILKPTYSEILSTEFYPYAEETLKELSKLNGIVLILYTSSTHNDILQYLHFFRERNIYFKYVNCNNDVPSTNYAEFSSKFYFNILLDDKAGFEGENDWIFFKNEFLTLYKINERYFN